MAPARRSLCGRGAAGARRPFALHLRSRPCRRPSRGVALRTCPQDWAALQQSVARAGCGALLEGASERDYLWAYTTIKSRTAEVLVDGAKANLLAPNFDMFNHDESARLRLESTTSRERCCAADPASHTRSGPMPRRSSLRPGSTHHFDDARRALVVVAARPYARGEWGSWLNTPSTLSEDSAPSASLDHLKAHACLHTSRGAT